MVKEDMIEKLIEHFKSPRYLLVISLIFGFLLFGRTDIIIKLGLMPFLESYRLWIGIVFLLSTGFWLVDLILVIIKGIKRKYTSFQSSKKREKRLKQLTAEEKSILGKYITNKTRTQVLDYTNGTVRELENYEIIYQSSNMSQRWTFFSYNIQPWAWNYLNKHKELLYTPIDEVNFK